MARVVKKSHSFICQLHALVHERYEPPVFAYPAEAGLHIPTPDGRKAEFLVITECGD